MSKFKAFNLLGWIEENKSEMKPPVNNKQLWADSQTICMMVGGPNKRRDFHVSPSEEFFYQIKGDCYVEVINDEGKREVVTVKEGEVFLLPGMVPHSPHRVANTYGLVIEQPRGEGVTEDMVWFCDKCDHELHRITMVLTNIEKQLKGGIEEFDSNEELRTCNNCGHVMSETVGLWK
ncbi:MULTISPECIES: 3-hydroxyanthranilate 3,4-dioxygenase [Virgibacillus]|uniref:3-hydroxyanthranilate 3,4-dioxygenase n=2 Tax=Virgibacillus TaxID=84406 RepID=A0A1H1ES64_9BACI|nr:MULTISPECIES: 3-hydroxyanthranilate 3,4-dioxygenase [Virgibacillus]MBP1947143.1 3-hydroxyanthranilate 3,4-dioxygenase [Virgibacillus litoralis]SDQ91593.1 3-hydroxyanthranilate 3,4-dioxygenase [Virgibacillus salinus]